MITCVQKWGNSQGLRLAKQVLDDAHIAVGDEVDVSGEGGVIVIRPVRRIRGKQDLKDLISRIPKEYRALETDWGQPQGKETW
jgi:antitoxin MazE